MSKIEGLFWRRLLLLLAMVVILYELYVIHDAPAWIEDIVILWLLVKAYPTNDENKPIPK